MATLSLIALLALGHPQAPAGTTTFTDPTLGLSFVHPSAWTQVSAPPPAPAPKKKKGLLDVFKKGGSAPKPVDDGAATFTIPGGSGAAPAQLTIVRASFSGAPEKWQEIQADSNRNLHRNVERQWQQEILGVPMLLTRIGYAQDGVPTTTVTGLLYNASPNKLLFRLTGPTSGFDATQFEFTQALETLRTTNDALPTAQEPGKEIPLPKQGKDAKHSVFARPSAKPVEAPVPLAVSAGTRKLLLRVPEGWTLVKVEGDTAVLRHPDVKSPVTVALYASATAPRPTEALTAATNKTLAEYKSVAIREDTPGTPNKAGNPLLAVWRRGDGPTGPLATLDAVVTVGDYYAIFSFRPSTGDDLKDERRTVQRMLDAVGLEPAP